MVQVDEQHGQGRGVTFQLEERLGQAVHEGGPVGQPRYRVVQGLVSQRLLRLDLRG